MLDIDIINDEALQEVVNLFLSSLLPHSNYNPECFSNTLNVLCNYIEPDEMKMEYKVLLSALLNFNKLKRSYIEFVPSLTRDAFFSLLSSSAYDLINDPAIGIKEVLQYEGKSTDLKIETVAEEAQQLLCNRSLELYDLCYELEIDSNTVLNYEPSLNAAFLEHVSSQSVNTQHAILRQGIRIGRKIYKGYQDWLHYSFEMATQIRRRLNRSEDTKVTVIDSFEGSKAMLKTMQQLFIPICEWGIPSLDDYTPILRHRMVVVVALENIGKTKFVIDQAANVLLSGHKVLFMCGESHKGQIYTEILVNYIYKKTGFILLPEHIYSAEDQPEAIQKAVNMAIDEIATSKSLILRDAYNYGSVYDEMLQDYENYNFDVCIIDHSCTLVGAVDDGSEKAKVKALSDACRNFRKAYPVCIVVTSHPSVSAKEDLTRDRSISLSPTRGAQELSTDADELFILRDNEVLRKQNLLVLENYKRRNAGKIEDVILQKKFEVSTFIYDEARQSTSEKLSLEKEQNLKNLERDFAESMQDLTDDDFI